MPTTNISVTPPAVDPIVTIKTLDELTQIIRSLHHKPVMDLTSTNYDAYLQTLHDQVDELEYLTEMYHNANQWVHLCNSVNWFPRLVGLARDLCGKGIHGPTKIEVTTIGVICTWVYNTVDVSIGVQLILAKTNEIIYGDWQFAPGVMNGFSYKPYTEDLLQTYFHSGIDTDVVWRLVEAIQQK